MSITHMQKFVLALTVAGIAAAGAPRAAESDKAAAVLAAARKAIGDKKVDALKSIAVDASVLRNMNAVQLPSEVEILLELPDKYARSETSSGPMAAPMTMGFNGATPIRPAGAVAVPGGGMIIRMGPGGPMPAPEKLSPDEQQKADQQLLRSARADISRLMLGWFAAAHPALDARYTYAGAAESPDGKAHVIDVTNGDGFSARLFIDQATGLPLMLTYKGPQPRVITASGPRRMTASPQRSDRGNVTAEEQRRAREAAEKELQDLQSDPPVLADYTLFFDDWRDVGGLRFPHKIRRAMSGTTTEEWTVNKVRVNPKIDPRKFEG